MMNIPPSLVKAPKEPSAEDAFTCSICFKRLANKGNKACNDCSQLYHAKCIDMWIRRGNGHCPFCNFEVAPISFPVSRPVSAEQLSGTSTLTPKSSVSSPSPVPSPSLLSPSLPESWTLKKRNHVVQVSHSWIVAMLPRNDYTLAVSRDGNCTALSRGTTFLWSTDIQIEGKALTYVWHAAIDEKRGRLLINFHNILDVFCRLPVNVYYVDLAELEQSKSARSLKAKATRLFSDRKWCCFGLRIDPVGDLLFCTDWYAGKIGIWDLNELSNNEKAAPKHVIKRPYELSGFKPTRCAIFRPDPVDPNLVQLAISDWLDNSIYLFKIAFINGKITSRYEATIATGGSKPARVAGPVDLQFDASGSLVICDQRNKRVQVFIAKPTMPFFDVTVSDRLKSMFSAIAICDNMAIEHGSSLQSTTTSSPAGSKHILVGLNNGEVNFFSVNV